MVNKIIFNSTSNSGYFVPKVVIFILNMKIKQFKFEDPYLERFLENFKFINGKVLSKN